MVKSANFCERHDGTFGLDLDASWRGRVLLEGEMSTRTMIVENIASEHASQMRLAEDDDVIQTLATQGSDQALRIRILPRT